MKERNQQAKEWKDRTGEDDEKDYRKNLVFIFSFLGIAILFVIIANALGFFDWILQGQGYYGR